VRQIVDQSLESMTSSGRETSPPERNAVNAEVTWSWNTPYVPLPMSASAIGVLPRLAMKISIDLTRNPTTTDITVTPA